MSEASTTERPASRQIRPLRMLIPFVRPHLGMAWAALAALLAATAVALSLPVAVRHMLDQGFGSTTADTDRYFFVMLTLAGLLALTASIRFYLVSRLGERVIADLRSAIYRRVLGFSPDFYETLRTGEVLSRLTTDTTILENVLGSSASMALRNGLTLLGGLAMLAITNPKLMGFILLSVPVVLLPLIVYGRKVRSRSRDSQDRLADVSAMAGETLAAIETVQAYTQERGESKRFTASVEDAFLAALGRIRARALLAGLMIAVIFSGVVLLLWLGARSVSAGDISVGELGQFVLYAIMIASSAAVLSEVWGEIQRAAGAAERLSELLAVTPKIMPPSAPRPLPDPVRGEVSFEAVNFSYPSRPGDPALIDFNLQIRPGETVALVGPSGAGKSTVFQLLLRFHDPQRGVISFDSVPLPELNPQTLRGQIAIVPQHTVIFAADARSNIRYGDASASDAEVETAARAAQAYEFIERMPEGFETGLGERGVRLSGGQRQRLAIARAILKDAPLLLLDEATSALDAQSERKVQAALENVMRGRTTLVIAHRLATIQKVDRIIVMDEGRIVAEGTHEELVAQNGLYARLAELQFDQKPDDNETNHSRQAATVSSARR